MPAEGTIYRIYSGRADYVLLEQAEEEKSGDGS
jgi:hypothetical protein